MYAEFIEDLDRVQPFRPWVMPEPWRTFPMDAIELPVDVVVHFTDPAKIDHIYQFEMDQVEVLRTSLRSIGLCRPIEMVIGTDAKMTLRDGHHRLVTFQTMGLTKIPVYFIRANKVNTFCRPLHEEMPYIVRALLELSGQNG